MKLLTTILSLYIFVIATMPCIDAYADASKDNVELTQNKTNSQQNDTDHCSPFCTCQCCASPIFFQATVFQFIDSSFFQKYLAAYSSASVSSTFASIWQPPKFSTEYLA